MSLDRVLLGMLDRPAAGYDLGREFESSAKLFWYAELSQIYPTLKRLERQGMLTSRKVASDRGPNRRVYERTPGGRAALEEWLREGPELAHARLPHVAQFFFLGQLGDPEATRAFLDRLERRLEERLAVYREIERAMPEEDEPAAMPDEEFHRHATLRAGILVAEARLAWCRETRQALERRVHTGKTTNRPATAPTTPADSTQKESSGTGVG
jgi:PadR family transcriptional regulator AphA